MKKILLIAMAVCMLASCTKKYSELDRDVIIIGAGGAGMAAALAAYEGGADVLIFEQMPMAGGNTSRATGGMNASETKFQKALGIVDTNQLFIDETMKGGYNKNDLELVTYMANNSAAAIDWLDSLGIKLDGVSFSGGFSVARIHRPADGSAVGSYLVSGLLKEIEAKGIEVQYKTTVDELIVKDGKVTGVKATPIGQPQKTYTAKAVIMATGGFGGNIDMVASYKPELKGFVTTNHSGATGSGILMAEKVGAQLTALDQIQIHPTVEQKTSIMITEALRGEGAILVNQSAKRFVNELLTRDVVSAAEIAQEGGYAYILFDDALKAKNKAINKYITQEIVITADSIEELAAKAGLDSATLVQTLKEYNEAVKAKKDNLFNRTTGLEPVVKAPYYMVKIAPGVHHTMGGIKINTNTQVLNASNEPISGFYAAGECTGGIHGGNRIGGNAVTDIIVFGRQAGTQASLFAKNNGGHGIRKEAAKKETATASKKGTGMYKDGVFRETVKGHNGDLTIAVTIKKGFVEKIVAFNHTETESIFAGVEKNLFPAIIEKQSADVDMVSGATVSSKAVVEAVTKILAANKK